MKTKPFLCLSLSTVLMFGICLSSIVAQRNQPGSPRFNSDTPQARSVPSRGGAIVSLQSRSSDGVWQKVNKSAIRLRLSEIESISSSHIDSFETFTLNPEAIKRVLQRASARSVARRLSQAGAARVTADSQSNQAELTIPMQDGAFHTFTVQESSIMAPELAAQFPEIKTYAGQGIQDESATLRLDYSPSGVHAMVISPEGSTYIDPLRSGDNRTHIVYSARDSQQGRPQFRCLVNNDSQPQGRANNGRNERGAFSSGRNMHKFRLALAATGEYTKFHGGSVNTAMAAIITTINRVNNIYQRDLGISMELVAKEKDLIYTDPDTDPYTNDAPKLLLKENQANIDNKIRPENYDIGHVFSTAGGGLAGLGVVCLDGSKARGETGLLKPQGDAFDVDFVAHEMGHQFGANHTFNAVIGNCGSGNRNPSSAVEPGSGSTIMGYAGICDTEDLQPHSDDYFHVISLIEITDYIASIADGLHSTPNGNSPPTVIAGPNRIIPHGTPFILTATGSDPDGDKITYCWEQFDTGEFAPPNTDADGISRPIFRSFLPTSSPSRIFPKLSNLLSNASRIGEAFPEIDRVINFRVTVRDNRSIGGAFSFDTVKVTISSSGAPFLVTEPNLSVTWRGGTNQTVAWNVGNTPEPPVNCLAVKISLSTDGGFTYPIILATNTPNDGSEVIVVPNIATSNARIKVEAADNVFFDISNIDFKITSGDAEPPSSNRVSNKESHRARPVGNKPTSKTVR